MPRKFKSNAQRKAVMAKITRNKGGYTNIEKPINVGTKVRIIKGKNKGESGVIMRYEGGGFYKIGHPSGHTEIRKGSLEVIKREI